MNSFAIITSNTGLGKLDRAIAKTCDKLTDSNFHL